MKWVILKGSGSNAKVMTEEKKFRLLSETPEKAIKEYSEKGAKIASSRLANAGKKGIHIRPIDKLPGKGKPAKKKGGKKGKPDSVPFVVYQETESGVSVCLNNGTFGDNIADAKTYTERGAKIASSRFNGQYESNFSYCPLSDMEELPTYEGDKLIPKKPAKKKGGKKETDTVTVDRKKLKKLHKAFSDFFGFYTV